MTARCLAVGQWLSPDYQITGMYWHNRHWIMTTSDPPQMDGVTHQPKGHAGFVVYDTRYEASLATWVDSHPKVTQAWRVPWPPKPSLWSRLIGKR